MKQQMRWARKMFVFKHNNTMKRDQRMLINACHGEEMRSSTCQREEKETAQPSSWVKQLTRSGTSLASACRWLGHCIVACDGASIRLVVVVSRASLPHRVSREVWRSSCDRRRQVVGVIDHVRVLCVCVHAGDSLCVCVCVCVAIWLL